MVKKVSLQSLLGYDMSTVNTYNITKLDKKRRKGNGSYLRGLL